MDSTLQALGQLITQAIPTVLIVLFLWFYLKLVFFGPMERVLSERDAATIGARKQADQSLKRAEALAADYEEKIRAARSEIYREQEEQRRKWQAGESARIAEARAKADQMVRQAREEIAAEAQIARESLKGNVQSLADEITATVLNGRRHEARS